jgi:hypothetical protein
MDVRRVLAALAVFGVVAGGLDITIGMTNAHKAAPPAPKPLPTPTPTPQVPTPAEFRIGVVVTDQNCSDPNGCVYRYRGRSGAASGWTGSRSPNASIRPPAG